MMVLDWLIYTYANGNSVNGEKASFDYLWKPLFLAIHFSLYK